MHIKKLCLLRVSINDDNAARHKLKFRHILKTRWNSIETQ